MVRIKRSVLRIAQVVCWEEFYKFKCVLLALMFVSFAKAQTASFRGGSRIFLG